jgi:hypothetical protein
LSIRLAALLKINFLKEEKKKRKNGVTNRFCASVKVCW